MCHDTTWTPGACGDPDCPGYVLHQDTVICCDPCQRFIVDGSWSDDSLAAAQFAKDVDAEVETAFSVMTYEDLRWTRTQADRDEVCFSCGYPFETGDDVLLRESAGEVVCSRSCAKNSDARKAGQP
jgi:hypothetical protein